MKRAWGPVGLDETFNGVKNLKSSDLFFTNSSAKLLWCDPELIKEPSPLKRQTVLVLLTSAWARVRVETEPGRSPLCEETPNGIGAGRDAAAPGRPTNCPGLCPGSYARHLHTEDEVKKKTGKVI